MFDTYSGAGSAQSSHTPGVGPAKRPSSANHTKLSRSGSLPLHSGIYVYICMYVCMYIYIFLYIYVYRCIYLNYSYTYK
jgi:hypothetical protein